MAIPDREVVLSTALDLFYSRGFRAIGFAELEHAFGEQAHSVRHHFKSLDDLIIAALDRRDEQFRQQLQEYVDDKGNTPVERLLSAFDFLQEWYESPGFHGCMFINACVEFPEKDSLINQAAERHKQALYEGIHELTSAVCPCSPESLSRQLILLMEGAIVTTQVSRSTTAASQARIAAEILLSHTLETSASISAAG